MHAKIMRNAKTKAPTANQTMNFADFVKQDAAAKIDNAEAAKKPDSKKVKQMVGPGKLAPMIDTGGGRMSRMVVAVRARPVSAKEQRKGCHDCLEIQGEKQIYAHDPDDKMGGLDYLRLNVTKDKIYMYDHAFGPSATSEQVYNKTMLGVVSAVMQGFHGSCFAYGATGSGKTFTMTGSRDDPGVIPQTVDALFAAAGDECCVKMQYVEIYNETIKDLLQPAVTGLDVREAPLPKGNFVAGAANVKVSSRSEVEALMEAGNAYRTTESTQLNNVSSRSHAVLQLRVEGAAKLRRAQQRHAPAHRRAPARHPSPSLRLRLRASA